MMRISATLHKFHHLIAFASIAIFLIVIGYDRLALPAFWDEPKIYFSALFATLDDPLQYFTGAATIRDRPPGLHIFYIPVLYLLGPSLIVIRSLNLFYFICGMFLFYRVTSKENRFAAILSVLFILTTPLFQVYSTQYVGDPQLFVLFALYLCLLYEHRSPWAIAAVGFFAGLTREPALALIPASLAYLYLRDGRFSWRTLLPHAAPLLGLGVHLARNYVHSGIFFNHITVIKNHLDLFAGPDLRWRNFLGPILATYRLLPFLVVALIFVMLGWRKLRLSPLLGFALFFVLTYFAVFTGVRFCLPRYVLPAIPFFVFLLVSLCTQRSPRGLRLIIAALLLLPAWFIGNPNEGSGVLHRFSGYQDTLEYPQVLDRHLALVAKLKAHVPANATVMTAWPFFEILRSGKIGYGPLIPYNLELNPVAPPAAIIWTDYPEQIPWSDVESLISQGSYETFNFDYKRFKLRLILSKTLL